MATATDNSSLLLYRVGPVLCCAPSLPVNSIIPPPTLTRPPGTNASKPGIFRHGGHITSSIDLRYKFGVNEGDWTDPCKVIVTEIDPGFVGFWVDQIMDVMDYPASGWGPLPAHLPRGIFSRTLILNKKIYLYAEFDQLYKIPDSGYLRVYIEKLLEEQQRHEKRTASASSLGSILKAGQSIAQEGNVSLKKTAHAKSKAHASGTTTVASPGNGTTKQLDPIKRNRQDSSTGDVSLSNVHHIQLSKNKTDSAITNTARTSKPLASAEKQSITTDKQPTSLISKSNDQTRTLSHLNNHQQALASKSAQATSDASQTHARALTRSNNIKSIPDIQATSRLNKAGSRNQNRKEDSSVNDRLSESVTNTRQATLSTEKTHTTELTRLISSKPVPPLTTAGTHNKQSFEENEPSGFMTGIFFLLVFIALFSVLFWHLTSDTELPLDNSPKQVHSISKPTKNIVATEQTQSVVKNEPVIKTSTTAPDNTVEDTENVTAQVTGETDNNEVPDSELMVTTKSDSETTETVIPADDNYPSAPATTISISTEDNKSTDFRAEIQKDEQGITIVLDAPEDENVFKQDNTPGQTSEMTPDTDLNAINTEIETSESSSVSMSAELSTSNQTVAAPKISETKPQSRVISTEIIHIVVKGDTLWHIAIKYVNDPYKYPELAKLSNIKNPDLIYPGNRVRIIKRTKTRR